MKELICPDCEIEMEKEEVMTLTGDIKFICPECGHWIYVEREEQWPGIGDYADFM